MHRIAEGLRGRRLGGFVFAASAGDEHGDEEERQRAHRRGAYAAVALAVAVLAGCGGDDEATVRVEPESSRVDEPVRVAVRGLEPRQPARLELRSTDAAGVTWTSSASYRADEKGRIDVAELGLFATMAPARAPANGRYQWAERGPSSFTLDVSSGGSTAASTTFGRTFPTGRYTIRTASVADTGFAGVYLAPSGVAQRAPVVVLGGASGGLPLPVDAFLLAARGYPVLALAYFAEEGLPPTLSRIPLEYFRTALEWVDERPHADGRGVVVWGLSRGSEAALLLGVHYPRLVRGVVALVPSNVSHCGSPDCSAPSWTLEGRALPFTRQLDEPRPTDEPRAVIPVERIRRPVFVVCGGLDSTWSSCAYARAIAARGRADLHEYRGAGHGLGTLAPYQPISPAGNPTHAADQAARADVWPKALAFLEAA
jgi:dienelactone hydrolase